MLQLPAAERAQLWTALAERIEQYQRQVDSLPVAPALEPGEIRGFLHSFDFDVPMAPMEALDVAAQGLTRWQVHTPHPRYFGLFNPCPTTMGIAADALTAAFNPQIAAWSHNPFAAEVEALLVRSFGKRLGYPPGSCDGTFCSGGMEANHTALLTALASRFPGFVQHGVRSLPGQPVFYVSAESHHSFCKAARLCGIGADALRSVEVDTSLRMRPEALDAAIRSDRAAGHLPFLVAATAGTTNAGAVDPLPQVADIARSHDLWFHVDAAWGGAAALVPELAPKLAGIERADSITFDAHKWLSVPMGAALYLTRDNGILDRTFRVGTAYMPKEAAGLDVVDPHLHSMQWSRRFIGLKLFLSLLVAGWDGYVEAIRGQVAAAKQLAELLRSRDWEIVADYGLGVICFAAPGCDAEEQKGIAMRVVASGEAWISTTIVGPDRRTVLRACVTNYRTGPSDIAALVEALERAR
jgi:glutamate/tyrosine decarboxylase-like PLP-dependent enzyme